MKKGFVLLEIIISVAISSMIGIIIFNGLYLINKSIKIEDKIISFDTRSTLIIQQLERDLSGAFIPIIFSNMKEDITKKTKTNSTGKNKIITKETKTTIKIKENLIQKGFYSEKDENNTSIFTFITNNPLNNRLNKKPIRIVRVAYQLKRKANNLFTLFRKETQELSFKKSETNNYEIIDDIKSFSVKFVISKKNSDNNNKKTIYNTWSSKQIEETSRSIPDYVLISIVLYDKKTKLSKKISFQSNLLINDLYADKKTKQKKEKLNKNIKKEETK